MNFKNIQRALCVLKNCLRSFLSNFTRERKKRALGATGVLLAVLVVLSAVITSDGWFFGLRLPLTHAADTVSINGVDCSRQSFEIYPNGGESGEKITLDGMMPENASAEAVDVTSDRSGIAAYDITITDGENEFQPGEENPIRVEINNPAIPESGNIQLWHIKDNGESEQITDFTLENGKLSFYATGFSIYEIVELNNSTASDYFATSVDELTSHIGFKLFYNYGSRKYFTSDVNGNGALVEVNKAANASVWYFEEDGDALKLYTMVNGQKKYLHKKNGSNEIELSDSEADLLEITAITTAANGVPFLIKNKNGNFWLQHSGSGSGIRYYTDHKNETNSSIYIQYQFPGLDESTIEQLNGNSYGLFHYADGSTIGNALMAEGDTHSLIKLVLKDNDHQRALYVDEDNEIDDWKFNYVPGERTFILSTTNDSGTRYLCAGSDGISAVTSLDQASRFSLQTSQNKVQLKSTDGYYLTFQPRQEEEGGSYFTTTTDFSNSFTWLYLLNRASLDDSDKITFSADRVSVSDIPNGQKVIVYLRIWNETELRYDMYAVDRDGSLYPCYASGGKILWLGDETGSLEWTFTEYYDAVTHEPNFYYELYNSYSEKYFAPQLSSDQVLSEDYIGINLPGRRDGAFYSPLIAWDNIKYAYIGLRPNADKTALEPCSESTALPFYFATLEELNLSDRLHEVPTLDNNQYGIKMKMTDFAATSESADGTWSGSSVTSYLSNDQTIKRGLLSNSLNDSGYPNTKNGTDFGEVFNTSETRTVNHIFLQRVHESGGYFEFDSTQNFATLKNRNEDGTVSWNEGTNGETNFTLYRELGTYNVNTRCTMKHGQFYPYDTIIAGVYSKDNPENLYSSLTEPVDQTTLGLLDDNDPRKHEDLHLIQTESTTKKANFYFGMEMEASFVQTPSGLDAWGHDIIFEFTGDDDFWLYVDGELVLDLGGIHSAVMGKINFRTGEVTLDKNGKKTHSDDMDHTTLRAIFESYFRQKNPNATDAEVAEYLSEYFNEDEPYFKDYSTHTMKMFYMERGAGASNLHMRFNIASVTPGRVVVSKSVTGEGAETLDTDFLEYPFQIYYTLPDGEGGAPGDEHLLGNDDEHIRVYYQNSNQPVTFVQRYRPPGFSENDAYENIYFINPSRSAEIAFPDDTIDYRIVECAVDETVYGNVLINGEVVSDNRIEIKGNLKSYSSEIGSAEEKPSISFDNLVRDNVIKDLQFTKKLIDENGNEITDDPATFSFRLRISSVPVAADEIPLTNMYHYYVLKADDSTNDKKMCRFDSTLKTFVETDIVYKSENITKLKNGELEYSVDDLTFTTSGFGSISGIPSGYTVCVPGLPVGSVFKVTEDVKTGYGLVAYERVMGDKKNADGQIEQLPSYEQLGTNPLNIGKVIADFNAQMVVLNRKGYGLAVNKQWSDLSLTTGHESVYTAVYVDGQLLENSVKQIKSPSRSAYYFWSSLQPKQDGSPRTSFEGYEVREVTISNDDPTVAEDGTVSNYGTVTPIDSGGRINLVATRTAAATPEGQSPDKAYDYIVSYDYRDDESSRTVNISNTREGGIGIRLFKWDSDVPLSAGKFTLLDSSGNTVGEYFSGADGIVTMLYEFDKNELYTLTQTAAPRGYVGLQKTVKFMVNNDGSVSLFYDDGTTTWGNTDPDDLKWANGKPGSGGISAYVDIYNKQFNFKVEKMDSEDHSIMLESAHFALYKQTNTSIGGLEKNRDPMTGFEDMVTENGVVYICGGNSGRTLNPGEKGSVFFLTETQAPINYTKLEDDILFRISPLGVPSIVSDSYSGQLIETEDSYIYTLSVPNERKNAEMRVLTVEKRVEGSGGEPDRDFNFTISISGAEEGDEGFEWYKNGSVQTAMPRTGTAFTLKHGEKAEIALPKDVSVTISEESGEYIATFKLNDGEPERLNSKSVTLEDDASLLVTNTLDIVIPTGVNVSMLLCLLPVLGAAAFIIVMILKKRLNKY